MLLAEPSHESRRFHILAAVQYVAKAQSDLCRAAKKTPSIRSPRRRALQVRRNFEAERLGSLEIEVLPVSKLRSG